MDGLGKQVSGSECRIIFDDQYKEKLRQVQAAGHRKLLETLAAMHQVLEQTCGEPEGSFSIAPLLETIDYAEWATILNSLSEEHSTWPQLLDLLVAQRVYAEGNVSVIYSRLENRGEVTLVLADFHVDNVSDNDQVEGRIGGHIKGKIISVCVPKRRVVNRIVPQDDPSISDDVSANGIMDLFVREMLLFKSVASDERTLSQKRHVLPRKAKAIRHELSSAKLEQRMRLCRELLQVSVGLFEHTNQRGHCHSLVETRMLDKTVTYVVKRSEQASKIQSQLKVSNTIPQITMLVGINQWRMSEVLNAKRFPDIPIMQ